MAAASFLMAALPAGAFAQTAPAAAMDGRWHFVAAPYMWFTGIKGDVSVANDLVVPIDMSFSDIWEDFDVGFQGHFEGRKNRLGFGVDFVWVNLGAPVAPGAPVDSVEVDVRQLVTEGFGFYRLESAGRPENPGHFDVLVGVRYTSMRTRLTLEGANGNEIAGDFQDTSWLDVLVGIKLRSPLGSRFALLGKADIAGLGSNFTWNIEADVAFRASQHWTVGLGWREMHIDYDNGDERPRKVVDIAYDGPRAWFAYSW